MDHAPESKWQEPTDNKTRAGLGKFMHVPTAAGTRAERLGTRTADGRQATTVCQTRYYAAKSPALRTRAYAFRTDKTR